MCIVLTTLFLSVMRCSRCAFAASTTQPVIFVSVKCESRFRLKVVLMEHSGPSLIDVIPGFTAV